MPYALGKRLGLVWVFLKKPTILQSAVSVYKAMLRQEQSVSIEIKYKDGSVDTNKYRLVETIHTDPRQKN
jgi:hypothetical protein